MRKVLEVDQGSPYFAVVPTPLAKLGPHFNPFVRRFAELDTRCSERRENLQSLEAALATAVFRDHASGSPITRGRSIRGAIAPGEFSVKSLRQLNAVVTETQGSSIRTDAVWMGARRPSEAWFVAPPVRELPRLLRDLCHFCNDATVPVFLRAVVGLHQLLLIHPFADGNGRTARALLAVVVLQANGSAAAASHLLDRLWEFNGMALQRSQIGIRFSDDWSEYLQLCLDALHAHFR